MIVPQQSVVRDPIGVTFMMIVILGMAFGAAACGGGGSPAANSLSPAQWEVNVDSQCTALVSSLLSSLKTPSTMGDLANAETKNWQAEQKLLDDVKSVSAPARIRPAVGVLAQLLTQDIAGIKAVGQAAAAQPDSNPIALAPPALLTLDSQEKAVSNEIATKMTALGMPGCANAFSSA